jgi:serine/threonine protein kinase/Flp pilus assembly protein TadD
VIPATISHYRILSKLGAGGMGEVYLAEDIRLNRKVAIKILPLKSRQDERANRRFLREAQTAAKLDHPNICPIYEVGEEEPYSFIALQYVEGETLARYIQRKALGLREALGVAVQVAAALAEAHAQGVVHRDIKPQNIMLTPRGQVKVLDFGLAKVLHDRQSADTGAETESLLTEPGVIVGTVLYMSPEQVRGEEVDGRSDIFSLGTVCYELLSGQHPFAAETMVAMISAILTREPAPLTHPSTEVPWELARMVSRALRKDKQKRYQTADELLSDLKSLGQRLDAEAKSDAVTGGGSALASAVRAARPAAAGSPQGALPARRRIARRTINSLAILPLVNATTDPSAEYLSDGITETIINSLSQLPRLRVMARSTVFRYKGREMDPIGVGDELNVRAVVLGRVLLLGDRLSIAIELVDAADGAQLWGEQFNRHLADIFAVQEEISREIIGKLRLKLTGKEEKKLTKRHTENTEAYHLYLKGRFHWNKRITEGFKKGMGFFQQAIEKDANYALAYAGLADCYHTLASFSVSSPQEVFPKGKAAAQRALEIDDDLAEAHASLGFITLLYDWDWARAEREFKRAIKLNPQYGNAHHWYSVSLVALGRMDEAIAELKRALELEPLSLIFNATAGRTYYYARQYDQAIEQCLKAIETDATFPTSYYFLALPYLQKGLQEEALAALQQAITLSGSSNAATAMLGYAYAVAGRRDEAMQVLAQLQEMAGKRYIAPFSFATIYAGLGEPDQAFIWLEKAYEERSNWMVYLKVEPQFDNLRSDSRFADLLRRVGHTV